MRNNTIVGHVKNVFYRFEFQQGESSGSTAKGNKPHVHAGITLHPEPDIVSASRICCNSLNFHTKLFKSDYMSLRKEGIVTDRADYKRWKTVVAAVNHHSCSATNFRCQKAVNAEGERICRYRRQPLLPFNADARGWFDEIPMPYTREVYELLQEIGLAHEEFDMELDSERWYVDEALKAGKWHYYALKDEFFLATIPVVSALCRSSTNVDCCDRKFQVSYLIKYISGIEERLMDDDA